MAQLPVAEARQIQRANPNFFRGAIDLTQADPAIQAALAASIFGTHANDRFFNCFHFAFGLDGATHQTKQGMLAWARKNGFILVPAGHESAHVDVWGDNDDSLAHACRLVRVQTPRSEDIWGSVMGAGQYAATHYRDSFAGGGYGVPIASFVSFDNWNANWMHFGQNFVG